MLDNVPFWGLAQLPFKESQMLIFKGKKTELRDGDCMIHRLHDRALSFSRAGEPILFSKGGGATDDKRSVRSIDNRKLSAEVAYIVGEIVGLHPISKPSGNEDILFYHFKKIE